MLLQFSDKVLELSAPISPASRIRTRPPSFSDHDDEDTCHDYPKEENKKQESGLYYIQYSEAGY